MENKKDYIISGALFILSIALYKLFSDYTVIKIFSMIAIATTCPIVVWVLNFYERDFKPYIIINAVVFVLLLGSIMVLYFMGELTACEHTPGDWIKDNNGYMHTECTKCGEVLQRRPQTELSIATPNKEDFIVEADSSMVTDAPPTEVHLSDLLNDDYIITDDEMRVDGKEYYICDAYGELTKYSGKEAGTYLPIDEYMECFGKYLVDNKYLGNESEWEDMLKEAIKDEGIIKYCYDIDLIVFEKKNP